MAILAAVQAEPLALAGLSQATGFHRATAHRLATALEDHGVLRRDSRGRFALGPKLVELGRAASDGFSLSELARTALEQLVADTGESAQLYVRSGDRRICIDAVESPHGLRTIVAIGATLPLDRGSAGRVLSQEPSVLRRGWAESVGEREAGVASVSAPIFDKAGTIRAAVSVSGPISRTTKSPGSKYATAVLEAAKSISSAAGW